MLLRTPIGLRLACPHGGNAQLEVAGAALCEVFLRRFAAGRALHFNSAATVWLRERPWPGNVRELQPFVQTCVALCDPTATVIGREIIELVATGEPPSSGASPEAAADEDGTLPARVAALERELIAAVLGSSSGNHSQAARILGVSRVGLLKKMDRLGLSR